MYLISRFKHRHRMRTWDLVSLIMMTWLSLAENPGSNRNREAILSSQQNWDISEKKRENRIFSRLEHSISQSTFGIWKPKKYKQKPLPEIFEGHRYFVDQALPRADSHFLVLSLSFNGFSAADNDALIRKCVHSESHKKWSRKATTTRKSGA